MNNKIYYYKLLPIFLFVLLQACSYNIPLNVNVTKDIKNNFSDKKIIPIKVGIYINEATKTYIYKQQKMGMIFSMKAGLYLYEISKIMALQMFNEAIYVDSLPPYEDYTPDVDAVVELEFLHCYGNAVGTLTGYITAEVGFKVTAYSLDGNVLWSKSASASKKSENINFATSFLGGLNDVGTYAYEAALSAAYKIIDDFYEYPPYNLYFLINNSLKKEEFNKLSKSDYSTYCIDKGNDNFVKKNFQKSLFWYNKSKEFNLNYKDELDFKIATCYINLGEKQKAIDFFKKIISANIEGDATKLSLKWLDRLNNPLNVIVIVEKSQLDHINGEEFLSKIRYNFSKNGIYNIYDVKFYKNDFNKNEIVNQINIENDTKLDAIIFLSYDYIVYDFESFKDYGDVAKVIKSYIFSKIYSVKHKKFIEDIHIESEDNIISGDTSGSLLKNYDRILKITFPKLIQSGLI